MSEEMIQMNKGIRLHTVNVLMVCVALAISIGLIYSTYCIYMAYQATAQNEDVYIQSRQSAADMIEGSNELTENARSFAVTGDPEYLQKYFETATVSKKRSNALDTLDELASGTPAYEALRSAMYASADLMTTEIYAMRLVIAAQGDDVSAYPEMLQRTYLKWQDSHLEPEEMRQKALSLLFDETYREQKNAIRENAGLCLDELERDSALRRDEASEQLRRLMRVQWGLIIFMILVVVSIVAIIYILVFRPLQKGVLHIRSKLPLRNEGSHEFRVLASAYNSIFEETRKRTEKLAHEATHDALTGLYNRGGYDFLCEHVDFTTSTLLLIDIDGFKGINDTYGHAIGDVALLLVADTLRNNFRSGDLICRLGGDEFVVIMRKTNPLYRDLIRKKVDRINEILQQPHDGIPPFTVSVGAAFGKEGQSAQALFRTADGAMYKAKQEGKSVCRFAY